MASSSSSADPFDDVLHLEERYYAEGYAQGMADGVRAGRVEGRSVGLRQGFDKFVEAGRLQAKAVVWANRSTTAASGAASSPPSSPSSSPCALPPLPAPAASARLRKNVAALYALVEPGTLSTENADDAVNDFDDRLRRAQGKLRVVERALGEDADRPPAAAETPALGRNEI